MTFSLRLRGLAALAIAALALSAAPASAQVKPRFLIAFDTSGSMATDFTGIPTFGDGMAPAIGIDTNCNGIADDSRMLIARNSLRNMLLAFGDVDWALARFPMNQGVNLSCNTVNNYECNAGGPFVSSYRNPNLNTGAACFWNWNPVYPTGPGCFVPAFRNRAGADPNVCINYQGTCSAVTADILEGWNGLGVFATVDNTSSLVKWVDGTETNVAADLAARTSGDYCNHRTTGNCELRPEGATPLGGLLTAANTYIGPIKTADPASACRPYSVILITDGNESCGGNPVSAATTLRTGGVLTYVVGLAIDAASITQLNNIATAGGTDAPGPNTAYFANNATELSAGLSDIVSRSLRVEVCNNADDNCNAQIDEGIPKYCNTAFGVAAPNCAAICATPGPCPCTLCAPPAEVSCDGIDNNCNGTVDEGLRNACGVCGPTPAEVCDGIDNNCNGAIDEGGVCSGCVPTAEICDGIDNNCNGMIDEGLSRACGMMVGRCTTGTQVCAAGAWGACSGIGPVAETCNNIDDDCDGVIDGMTQPCGSGVGACRPGTQTCTAGAFGACSGSTGPTAEVCDGIDNNCNGSTDEGNPGGGGTCGSSIGACLPGTLTCSGGMLVCTGGTSASPETCNNIDDNCDGSVDNGIATMGACGSSTGTCSPGVLTCVAGSFVCTGSTGPVAEICDGLDNNCNGTVDEGNPGGGASCGSMTGACTRGMTVCTAGSLVCSGGIGPTMEVCNNIDDDCNGLVDDGVATMGPCGSSVGACRPGVNTCVMGSFMCVGATTATPEICNGIDDNCDGTIDEGDPEGGTACGMAVGACMAGVNHCLAGVLTCVGGVGPSMEVCNGVDDNCNGVVDEGLGLGAPCGTDTGECSPGLTICMGGTTVCSGAIGPMSETCNGLDDDCNGLVDDGLGVGSACGSMTGTCTPGTLQCVGGRSVCVGSTPPGTEACDCLDNDCDGTVDNPPSGGSLCPAGSACVECGCSRPCMHSEFGDTCPTGRTPFVDPSGICYCVAPRCEDATCATETHPTGSVDGGTPQCAPGTAGVPVCICKNNACTFPCDGVVCTSGTVCSPSAGTCVINNCLGLGCPAGMVCDTGTGVCGSDRCTGVSCPEACRDGVCEASCATLSCAAGQLCVHGTCTTDRCATVHCTGSAVCDPATGTCGADPCATVTCATGTVCVAGSCTRDPCATLHCPSGETCSAGECTRGGGPDAGVDMGPGVDLGVDLGHPTTPSLGDRVLASGGGGCVCSVPGATTSARTGLWALLSLFALLALVVTRRRGLLSRIALTQRAKVGVAIVSGFFLAATGSGCNVDPYCLHCGDSGPVDSGPVDTGLHVDTGIFDMGTDTGPEDLGDDAADACNPTAPELCNHVDDNCNGMIDEGIDVTTDPMNCGGCGMPCTTPHAFPSCIASVCGIDSCDVGFYDLDHDPTNGCEYRCLPTTTDDAICDLRDNDCDGMVDEDVHTDTDPHNCGGCAIDCLAAHATSSCTAGLCTIGSCDANFWDLDVNPMNGCEYSCTQASPAVETCNSRDDDCNGTVDEGDPGSGGTCGSSVGACMTGIEHCMMGALVCVGGVSPSTEACNGTDDNCDGAVDEGNPGGGALCGSSIGQCTQGRQVCTAGSLVCTGDRGPVAEICNGLDDNCDGAIDDGDPGGGSMCGSSVGACSTGMNHCVGGTVVCMGAVGGTAEVCDGIDNNCNGTTDEGNPGGGGLCGSDIGQCHTGTNQCMGGTINCVGATGPVAETCNALDDNCNGMIDEGNPGGGAACGTSVGACSTGTQTCLGGTLQCVGGTGPSTEICDTIDNNCNGMTDEGFMLMTDPRNCGSCGRVCSLPNATAACAGGGCTIASCNSGFVNLDGIASNGCEYACSFAGAEICNGRDDNCNGSTDEGLTPPVNFCNPNGVCAGTVAACSGAGGWTCTYVSPRYQATETLCDGFDNNCNGSVDEPFPLKGTACANGIGACRRVGTYICNPAQTNVVCNAAAAGSPTTELCNNIDDNCNGLIDDAIPASSIPTVTVPKFGGGTVQVMAYEASRADATAASQGTAAVVACSNPNVLPWTTVTRTTASQACCALNASGTCAATGWRLCDAPDWQTACHGPGGVPCTWSYAAACTTSAPLTCNGNEFDADGSMAGTQHALAVTGSPTTFSSCYANWAAASRIYDMSGNAKEWTNTETSAGSGLYYIRGGSYNNVENGRTCDFNFTVAAPSFAFPNTGFRCCNY